METDFILASLINLVMNLFYTVIALFVAVGALVAIDKMLLKEVDLQEELKKNNLAVAVFAASMILFVALIICFGMKT